MQVMSKRINIRKKVKKRNETWVYDDEQERET